MEIGTVLEEYRSPSPPAGTSVFVEAIDRGWIRPFGQGQYLYGPEWTAIVRMLQERFIAQAQHLGFEEWIFPRLIPSAALDSFELTQYKPELLLDARRSDSSYLDPVQCVSLYHSLRGQVLQVDDTPIRIVEALGGWTWRNEVTAELDGPYRAIEFNRVEHVYIGTADQVRACRTAIRSSICSVLQSLGLSWQVVVGAGCMDLPGIEQLRASAITADDVPVQDIEVPIRGTLQEHRGRPADFSTLQHSRVTGDGSMVLVPNDAFYVDTDEIAGCSVEGTHLPDQFGLESESGVPLWSGCCGVGLNRVVTALLYQHGFESPSMRALSTRQQ